MLRRRPPQIALFLEDLPGAERVFLTLAGLWQRTGTPVRLGLWSNTGPLVSTIPPHITVDVLGGAAQRPAGHDGVAQAGGAVAAWMHDTGATALLTGMPWASAVGVRAKHQAHPQSWRLVWSERTEPAALYGAMPAQEAALLFHYAQMGATLADAAIAVSARCAQEMVQL